MFIIAIGIMLVCGASLKSVGIVTIVYGSLKTIKGICELIDKNK